MLWSKYKYSLTVSGGTVSGNTDFMRGMVEQLYVYPTTSTTQWDLNIIDRDGDIVYSRTSETGNLSDKAEIPVGRDSNERFTMQLLNVTANEVIKLIFRVREQY